MATKKKEAPVSDEQNEAVAPETRPTIEQAQAMFADTPGLAWVLTDDGNLSRDGILQKVAHGE